MFACHSAVMFDLHMSEMQKIVLSQMGGNWALPNGYAHIKREREGGKVREGEREFHSIPTLPHMGANSCRCGNPQRFRIVMFVLHGCGCVC